LGSHSIWEEGALEALLSIVPEQTSFPKKRGLEIGFLASFLILGLVLAVLCRSGSFESVDHVDDDFDGRDQCDQQKD